MIAAVKFLARNFITIALVVIALIVVFGAGAWVTGKIDEFRDFFFPETSVHVRSQLTIVNSITGMGQLVTVKSELHKTDLKIEIERWVANLGGYSANHVVIGAIEAGIDFEQIDEDSLSFENEVYTLTLPAPVITSCRIEHIDQNQHSFTLAQADWDMLRQIAHAVALEQFAKEVIEKGILERAEDETALRISNFVSELTGKQARVKFAERASELALPESCQPIAPSGWEKNEKGAWKQAN